MREFDSLNIHEDYRERFQKMYSGDFTFNSANELVLEDGTRAGDFLKREFEGKDAFIKNSMKSGAGVDGPAGGKDDNIVMRAWNKSQQ